MPRRDKLIDFASARDLAEATILCEDQVRAELAYLADIGEPPPASFQDWAEAARRARAIWRRCYLAPLQEAEERLRREAAVELRKADLHEFAAALVAEDYRGLEF
jgi:hypothetical protein